MSEISKIEIMASGGYVPFAHLMSAMSILSDVQEELAQVSPTHVMVSIGGMLNHAKEHMIRAMSEIHKEHNLPGQFLTNLNMEEKKPLVVDKLSTGKPQSVVLKQIKESAKKAGLKILDVKKKKDGAIVITVETLEMVGKKGEPK